MNQMCFHDQPSTVSPVLKPFPCTQKKNTKSILEELMELVRVYRSTQKNKSVELRVCRGKSGTNPRKAVHRLGRSKGQPNVVVTSGSPGLAGRPSHAVGPRRLSGPEVGPARPSCIVWELWNLRLRPQIPSLRFLRSRARRRYLCPLPKADCCIQWFGPLGLGNRSQGRKNKADDVTLRRLCDGVSFSDGAQGQLGAFELSSFSFPKAVNLTGARTRLPTYSLRLAMKLANLSQLVDLHIPFFCHKKNVRHSLNLLKEN